MVWNHEKNHASKQQTQVGRLVRLRSAQLHLHKKREEEVMKSVIFRGKSSERMDGERSGQADDVPVAKSHHRLNRG